MSKAVTSVTDALFGAPDIPDVPEAKVPAQAAPSARADTGANVVVGADAASSTRVSGKGSGSSKTTRNVLGGLGTGSGLNI
jgi:hypothetical protein